MNDLSSIPVFLQHDRPPCPSLSPGVCPTSHPLNQWCYPTMSSSAALSSLLSSVFPCIRVFSSESAFHIRWPKYWSFSFSISPCNEYSGLIYFRTNWFDLLAVQGTLKSLPLHHSSKALIFWHSAFFIVQRSHLHNYWKNHSLIIQTFVGKVMSLLFNTLSRFVIAFLPRSKCLLISWLQSPSTVILEPKKIKSATVSILPRLFAMKW